LPALCAGGCLDRRKNVNHSERLSPAKTARPALAADAGGAIAGEGADETVSQVVAILQRLAESSQLSADQLRTIVSATTSLYATASERAGHELPPVDTTVSTTDAITLACALVRSQDLTPFEMAMWFSRGPRHD
jgi:hypothetical protein